MTSHIIRLLVPGLALCAACGSGAKAGDQTPTAPAVNPAPEAASEDSSAGDLVTRSCANLIQLATEQRCEFLEGMQDATVEECVSSNQSDYEQVNDEQRALLDTILTCTADAGDCNAALACFEAALAGPGDASQDEPTAEARQCGEMGFGPVILDAADAAGRYGINARTFSEAPSTKDKPVEVCGVGGQLVWLQRVTCDDGSNPFKSRHEAHASRSGSVGVGGRCANILDEYVVPCPETTYTVFLDAYMCGPGESF